MSLTDTFVSFVLGATGWIKVEDPEETETAFEQMEDSIR